VRYIEEDPETMEVNVKSGTQAHMQTTYGMTPMKQKNLSKLQMIIFHQFYFKFY